MKNWIVLLGLTASLLAGKCEAQGFRGFYAGLNGGGQITTARGCINNNYGFINLYNDVDKHVQKEDIDIYRAKGFGSFYLGYGQTCSCFFAGVEGFINFPKHQVNKKRYSDFNEVYESQIEYVNFHENLDYRQRASSRSIEYGIDFKPGVLLGPCTLLYGRVGAAFNRFNFKSKSIAGYSDESIGHNLSPISVEETLCAHRYKQKTGLRLGVGFEQLVWGNFGITLDYIYTYYGNICLSGSQDTTVRDRTVEKGLAVSSDLRLRNHAVLLGISYRFCFSSLTKCFW